jgi:hypothetical protein
MSEPFSDNLVQSICYLMNAVFEDSSGDYLTHEQARKLRAVVGSHEILSNERGRPKSEWKAVVFRQTRGRKYAIGGGERENDPGTG